MEQNNQNNQPQENPTPNYEFQQQANYTYQQQQPSQQQQQQQQQGGGWLSFVGGLAQQGAILTAGLIKKGAESLETALKDPELGTKIKEQAVSAKNWTQEKYTAAKQSIQDPNFKENMVHEMKEKGQQLGTGLKYVVTELQQGIQGGLGQQPQQQNQYTNYQNQQDQPIFNLQENMNQQANEMQNNYPQQVNVQAQNPDANAPSINDAEQQQNNQIFNPFDQQQQQVPQEQNPTNVQQMN